MRRVAVAALMAGLGIISAGQAWAGGGPGGPQVPAPPTLITIAVGVAGVALAAWSMRRKK